MKNSKTFEENNMRLSEIKKAFGDNKISALEFDFEANYGSVQWVGLIAMYDIDGNFLIDLSDDLIRLENFICNNLDFVSDNSITPRNEKGVIKFSLMNDEKLSEFIALIQADNDEIFICPDDFEYIFEISKSSTQEFSLDLTEFVSMPIEEKLVALLSEKVHSISFNSEDFEETFTTFDYKDCIITDDDEIILKEFMNEMREIATVTHIDTGEYSSFNPECRGVMNIEIFIDGLSFDDGASTARGVYEQDGEYFVEFALTKQYTYEKSVAIN